MSFLVQELVLWQEHKLWRPIRTWVFGVVFCNIYLAALGVGHGTSFGIQTLRCGMWDLAP